MPLVDRPFIAYMLEWLRGHGVDDVILSCGFMADGVRDVLGDGSGLGIRLRYLEEPEPLGTGGALKFAEELLDERFFMLNGDVLTDIDLTAQLAQHERPGRAATLALIAGRGSRRRTASSAATPTARCSEFVEKPGPEEIDTNLINAGAYMLEREVLDDDAAAGTQGARSSARSSRRWSATACSAYARAATGSTSARPRATCRRPSTSSRAT